MVKSILSRFFSVKAGDAHVDVFLKQTNFNLDKENKSILSLSH